MTESVASGSQSAEVQEGSSTSSSSPMLSYFGRMDAFDSKVEEWSMYVERLEIFFVVNNVPDDKKAASLLTLIGGRMYKFHKYHQEEGQSIREFLAKLQKLAETCEFGGYRDEALRDRLVCGITSQTIRRKLLGEADLTLKKAVDIAVGMELTDKEITQISAVQQVHKVQLQECFRCGKHNHSPDKCFHKLSECHIFKRKGHISPKCPQKISSKPPASSKPKQAEAKQNKSFKKKKKSSRIKFVDTQGSSSGSEVPEDESNPRIKFVGTQASSSESYTPVTDKPNSKLDTPLPEQGNSLTFPTAEESAMQEEPKTLTMSYSQRERKPPERLIEQM
ncbi:hypothetical protein P5673_032858 [Acropora cervicornis]|uniref:Uncharacterized protein n=1 Tax=Acropora cervicornis TaxID=6130 RepID=A0AAD9PR18_ACRCE|nr:hypothetical protein P5673_032858 [Acropora cervicornis]